MSRFWQLSDNEVGVFFLFLWPAIARSFSWLAFCEMLYGLVTQRFLGQARHTRDAALLEKRQAGIFILAFLRKIFSRGKLRTFGSGQFLALPLIVWRVL